MRLAVCIRRQRNDVFNGVRTTLTERDYVMSF
ncbi:protein of unknown function [Pseudomonas mediterranea]